MSRYATTYVPSLPCWPKLTILLQLGRASPSGDKPFAWRMQHPERKYQLFPKDNQTAASPGKPLDPEQAQAFALARSQTGEKNERMANLHLRVRINQREMRNRKIGVSDLAPLTTVQEAAMDSRMSIVALALISFVTDICQLPSQGGHPSMSGLSAHREARGNNIPLATA